MRIEITPLDNLDSGSDTLQSHRYDVQPNVAEILNPDTFRFPFVLQSEGGCIGLLDLEKLLNWL